MAQGSLALSPVSMTDYNAGRSSAGFSIPPPVGGLNYIDELANMNPRDALILENIFPQPSYVELRRGYQSHVTGLPGSIMTLMEWSGPSSKKLKAVSSGGIYDVTTSGAVGAAEVTGLGNNQFQTVNFKTPGGSFLVAVNGTDAVQNYDGTNWTTPTLSGSGLTSANLINVTSFKSRLWYVEKNTTNAWYGETSSIAGAVVKQDLGVNFKLGGALIAIGTISQDSGDGIDDNLVFVSSRGEFSVWQGTDPTNANTWALVGNYRIGYPIGYRCLVDVGGDLGLICSDGIISIHQAMAKDRQSAQRMAITNKIQRLFNMYNEQYGSLFGWSPLIYPKGNWALFNIPTSTTAFVQLVMNTISGAWCKFTNMNGVSWGLLGDDIYFGDATGTVWKADTGYQDNGGIITAELKTAWNYFGPKDGRNFLFTLIRPILQVTGAPAILFAFDTDFNDTTPTGSIAPIQNQNNLWGTATWGMGVWGGALVLNNQWQSAAAIGYCGSAHMLVTSNGNQVIVNSFDIQAVAGGAL